MDAAKIGGEFPCLSATPERAAELTGFSRTKIFEAIKAEKLTARKNGKTTVIEASELARWVRSMPARGRVPDQRCPA
jgi:excisionase family DNA binding protein